MFIYLHICTEKLLSLLLFFIFPFFFNKMLFFEDVGIEKAYKKSCFLFRKSFLIYKFQLVSRNALEISELSAVLALLEHVQILGSICSFAHLQKFFSQNVRFYECDLRKLLIN